jgi:myo-inositol 2-dehydrogenase / D-chiro-inositol 1-dehydrogenase
MQNSSRRQFLRNSATATAAAVVTGFPTIVPSTVFGQSAPSNLLQIAQLGCGRIARSHDIPDTIRHTGAARYVAVCDLDTVRLEDGKQFVEGWYAKKLGSEKAVGVKTYRDYRQMLDDKSIDGVVISTPDHWHAQPAIEAALAGKDIYLQKPTSLTIEEGRQMTDVVKRTGRILQLGSQQRSDLHFRLACELVRNGRLGALKEIYVGLPIDPSGDEEPPMPVPANLDYEMWLGSTPEVYYTEKRVHPQSPDMRIRYDRPGWLRCEQFGAGMITGWGVHHIDIAHWAMGVEESGPVAITGDAHYPKSGLWDVHGTYHVRATYSNGVTMYISDKYDNGLRFIGEDGWLWVTRGRYTLGDPKPGAPRSKALDASDLKMLRAGVKDNELRLHASPKNDHHLDWLESMKSRKPPAAPAEVGHRSCSACLIAHAAMKLGRELKWDPAAERFINDDEANATLSRPQRAPYGTHAALRKAKLATG